VVTIRAETTLAATIRAAATEMRSPALRLYTLSITLLVFFLMWAVIAARPWVAAGSGTNPALDRLTARERHLRHEASVVKARVRRRWAAYQRRLRARQAEIRALERRHAAQLSAMSAVASSPVYGAPTSRVVTLPPQVRVVTLPPTSTPSTSSGSSAP
jgi:hypothetical protein